MSGFTRLQFRNFQGICDPVYSNDTWASQQLETSCNFLAVLTEYIYNTGRTASKETTASHYYKL